MEKEKELCMTPVDLAAGGEELQLLKALVPYLALGLQKPFVLLIKCMEIRNLTAFFSPTRGTHGSECPGESQPF